MYLYNKFKSSMLSLYQKHLYAFSFQEIAKENASEKDAASKGDKAEKAESKSGKEGKDKAKDAKDKGGCEEEATDVLYSKECRK